MSQKQDKKILIETGLCNTPEDADIVVMRSQKIELNASKNTVSIKYTPQGVAQRTQLENKYMGGEKGSKSEENNTFYYMARKNIKNFSYDSDRNVIRI